MGSNNFLGMTIYKCDVMNLSNAVEDLDLYYGKDKNQLELITLADLLAKKGGSHSKFLRHISVYLKVIAPRFWWVQFDTYKFAEKQSQSTMTTILKEPITQSNFSYPIPETYISYLNEIREKKDWLALKCLLPESFLQTRGITTNYDSLRKIYHDRANHKLPQWKFFCEYLENYLIKSEWITNKWEFMISSIS